MLTKVVEKQSPESMEMHVAEVMPGLLKVSFSSLTQYCESIHFSWSTLHLFQLDLQFY